MEINIPKRFELRDIDELKPYDNNARTHSAEQLDRLCYIDIIGGDVIRQDGMNFKEL